jgi:energy-converting hydrogenase Eha subunit A
MSPAHHEAASHDGRVAATFSRQLAALSLAVLLAGAVLFAGAWLVGGQGAVSDNWVGVTVVVGLFAGLAGALTALLTSVVAVVRHEPWKQLWLPLAAFPAVVLVVGLLEAFVLE